MSRNKLWFLSFIVYSICILMITAKDILSMADFSWYIIPIIGYNCYTIGTIEVLLFSILIIAQNYKIKEKIKVIFWAIIINYILFPILFMIIFETPLIKWQKYRITTPGFSEYQEEQFNKEIVAKYERIRKKVEKDDYILLDTLSVRNGVLKIYINKLKSELSILFESNNNIDFKTGEV